MECHSQSHSANSFQAYDLNGTGVRVAVQRKRSDWSRLVAQGGPRVRPACGFESRCVRLDAQPVVYGVPKLLFAPEVALGRLDRDVPEQKLDLVQFAAGQVAQSRTGASQVVRSQLRDAGFGGRRANDIPQHLRGHAVPPDAAHLADGPEHRPVGDARRRDPCIDCVLDPSGHGNRADVPTLPDEISDDPVLLALLNPRKLEPQQLAASDRKSVV